MTLPNFLIIGAPKAGTTGLYQTLRHHPQIFLSQVKEPNFFLSPEYFKHINNEQDYRALFNNIKPQHLAIGEASVGYLGWPKAAKKIYAAIPEARLIAILRQPAERIYSHYLMYLRVGEEKITNFSTIVDAMTGVHDIPLKNGEIYRMFSLYSASLKRYLTLFPREQMCIFLYEDWKNNSDQMMHELLTFLKVTPDVKLKIRHDNAGGLPLFPGFYQFLNTPNPVKGFIRRLFPYTWGKKMIDSASQTMLVKAPPLDPELRFRLNQIFRDDILELQDLICRDLSAWLA